MNEHPILFSTPMVQAILNGRKTQTRRVINPDLIQHWFDEPILDEKEKLLYSRKKVGDRLWVRETWCNTWPFDGHKCEDGPCYKATDDGECGAAITGQKWTTSIHMPHWASRITLEIVNVRLERVKEISEKDAEAEGVCATVVATTRTDDNGDSVEILTAIAPFSELWDSINAKRGYGWDANPWVWVIEFKKVD